MGLMLATWPRAQHLAVPRCAHARSDGDIRALPPASSTFQAAQSPCRGVQGWGRPLPPHRCESRAQGGRGGCFHGLSTAKTGPKLVPCTAQTFPSPLSRKITCLYILFNCKNYSSET